MKQKKNKGFSKLGKIEGFQISVEFNDDSKITQQKGRRVPLQLQEAVEKEIQKVLDEGHRKKVYKITDDVFIQPVDFTVKKDRSVKIALDARALNAAIKKRRISDAESGELNRSNSRDNKCRREQRHAVHITARIQRLWPKCATS